MGKKPPVKWIKLARNQCALNSHNVGGSFPVVHSLKIEAGTANDEMIKKVPKGIKHLIFNCHGYPTTDKYPAHLSIAQTLKEDNVHCCAPIKGSCKVIWLSACNIGGGEDGLNFCKKLAEVTDCYVVTQTMGVPDRKMKQDCVEDYHYAMPKYIKPGGKDMITRGDFFKLHGELEFKPL